MGHRSGWDSRSRRENPINTRLSRISQTDNNVSGEQVVYTYDAVNRLATAGATSSSWGQSYSYDGFGNLTAQTVTAGSAPSYQANPDPTTNHVGSVDANGNTLVIYGYPTYDVENRFVGPGSYLGYQYSYAPGNKRVWRGLWTNGTLSTDEVTFWSASGQKMASYNIIIFSGNGPSSPPTIGFTLSVANYYFGGKMIGHYTQNYGLSVTSSDRLGSIGKYYPYGQEKPSATTNGTEKFTGYFRDSETGFDYASYRYHDPGTGRFLTPDPYIATGTSTGSANPTNPGTWNRYAYVQGDPVNYYDPSGLEIAAPGDPGSGCVIINGVPSMDCDDWGDGGGGGGGGGGGTTCGPGTHDDGKGNCVPDPQCSLELEYRKAALTGRSHASLVVTDSEGYTFTIQGEPQNYPRPKGFPPTFGKLLVGNTPGNIGDAEWGPILMSTVDPGLCNQIADIETAENYYSNHEVTYYPWGPNSNSLVNWLLQSGFVSQYFTAPPLTTGWSTPLYGTLFGIPGSGGH